MAKVKARDKRKKAAIKKQNQAREQRRQNGEFVKSFSGYMQISLREETTDEAILAGVKRCGDWLKSSRSIFKHQRRYLLSVLISKNDKSITPAEMEVVTPIIPKEYIVDVARDMAEELTSGESDIDYNNSYIRIFA